MNNTEKLAVETIVVCMLADLIKMGAFSVGALFACSDHNLNRLAIKHAKRSCSLYSQHSNNTKLVEAATARVIDIYNVTSKAGGYNGIHLEFGHD